MRPHHLAIGEHVIVLVLPLAGGAAGRCALEDQHASTSLQRGEEIPNAAAGSPPRRRGRDTARVSVGGVGDCGSETPPAKATRLRKPTRGHTVLRAARSFSPQGFPGSPPLLCARILLRLPLHRSTGGGPTTWHGVDQTPLASIFNPTALTEKESNLFLADAVLKLKSSAQAGNLEGEYQFDGGSLNLSGAFKSGSEMFDYARFELVGKGR
jgi:hypothetical protein